MQYGRYDRQRFRHPGEARALQYVEERGHILLRHNYHTRFGEIDLITTVPSEDYRLHAIEVKAWRNRADYDDPFVHPLRSLNARKQAKMRRVIESFRMHASRKLDFRVVPGDAAVSKQEEQTESGDDTGRERSRPIDEPAWILARAGCPVSIAELDISFDLLWLFGPDGDTESCEYFTDLF